MCCHLPELFVPKLREKGLSEDEAATMIQKHIKGYVTRKKYGPLVTTTGKLDNSTAMFIKEYFRRWRAKSIYQVLLLYRAAKHQELVYFCQQVHLYNQNIVSAFRSTHEIKINLKAIKPDVNPEIFIGKEKPAVWKLPFKIKDFPFVDSSKLCTSVYKRDPTPDEVPWDDPFKCLDKGCQTGFDEVHGRTYGSLKKNQLRFSSFVETPYDRDPSSANSTYGKQKFFDEPDDSLDRNGYEVRSPRKVKPYVAYSAPTPRYGGSNEVAEAVNCRKLVKAPQPPKVNPISELEMRGRKLNSMDSSTINEDDPPYNFQGMLRKTNYRPSVHRGPKSHNLVYNSDETNNNRINSGNINSRYGGDSLQGKRSTFNRKDSFESVVNSKGFGSIKKKSYARTEILPGFYVMGQATDL